MTYSGVQECDRALGVASDRMLQRRVENNAFTDGEAVCGTTEFC